MKAYKDYLIVLRRGRLFTVKTMDAGKQTLVPVSRVNAYPDGMTPGSWYDELLIQDQRIVVVGYSYHKRATEIGLFRITDDGMLNHEGTYFLDSDDYYSSRNYASRLVDGKLVFYMPYFFLRSKYVGNELQPDVHLPAMKKWITKDETEERSILQKVDISKPVQDELFPALHTVVMCDLKGALACSAKAVLGPSSRNFYVSPNAVYLWVTTNSSSLMLEESAPKCFEFLGFKGGCARPEPKPDAYVYRLDLRDGSTTVLRADGSPIDQFSFKEADGYLNVLVRSEGRGDWMWRSETTTGDLALLRAPLTAFSGQPNPIAKNAFTPLPAPDGYGFQNRFVGDYVLYGSGGAWWGEGKPSTLYLKKYATGDGVQTIDLTHGVDRIEVLGDGAVVIGAAKQNLQFSSIAFARSPEVKHTFTLEKASQGELRSHGFFYSPKPDGTGVLGIPIRTEGDAIDSHFRDSAAVLFLHVDEDKQFTRLGSLAGKGESDRDDQCVASCVDWYGNARPIFFRGRIFALLGYELIEGTIRDGAITETAQTNFAPTR